MVFKTPLLLPEAPQCRVADYENTGKGKRKFDSESWSFEVVLSHVLPEGNSTFQELKAEVCDLGQSIYSL